jgi:hypothetical protein
VIRVSELTGAQLDYWTARAEGIPAEQLTIRRVPRTDNLICVHSFYDVAGLGGLLVKRVDYSSKWETGGPLIEKHRVDLYWIAGHSGCGAFIGSDDGHGDTPLQAICRAVVRAAFGDEVEEVPIHD